MSKKTLFDEDDNPIAPSEKIEYLCHVALQIQSVWHSTKDRDAKYYSQVWLDQCCYEVFADTRKIDPRLKRKNKPDPRLKRKKNKAKLELEECNEDTVIDE